MGCIYFNESIILFQKNWLSIDNKKSLFFLSDFDNNIHLSSNNIRNSIVKNVQDINTYDIVNADNIVFVEDSIEKLNTILK